MFWAKTSRGNATPPATAIPAARSKCRRVKRRSIPINVLQGTDHGWLAGTVPRWPLAHVVHRPPRAETGWMTASRLGERDECGAVSGRRSLRGDRVAGTRLTQLLVSSHGRLAARAQAKGAAGPWRGHRV